MIAADRSPHGGDGARLARRLGLEPDDVIDLSASLNPFAPDVAALVRDVAADVGRYPDAEAALRPPGHVPRRPTAPGTVECRDHRVHRDPRVTRLPAVAAGVALDRWLGEPPTAVHPVVWFGTAMAHVERALWRDRRAAGIAHASLGVGGAG